MTVMAARWASEYAQETPDPALRYRAQSLLAVAMTVFTLIEAVVGICLLVGLCTRAAAAGVTLLALGILLSAGWLGTTCVDEWQIGLLGVVMRRFSFPTAPVVVGMILGPLAEAQMRNALAIGEGHWSVFVQRPMSFVLLLVVIAVLLLPRLMRLRKKLKNA